VSDSQLQVPACSGVEVTCRFFSNAARSATGRSKFSTTGIPTPTLLPSAGRTVGKTCWSRVSCWVLKVAFSVVAFSAALLAVVLRVYVADGSSRSAAVQVLPSSASSPLTVPLVGLPLLSVPE
jgi:hypothetical protein